MRNRKNNIIIGSLLSVLLVMSIGYAAFSSSLNIKGTSNISSNWDIEITNIRSTNSYTAGDTYSGTGYDAKKPTYTSNTATFNAGLERPGDFMLYEIEVSNLGSLSGQITVTDLSCGNNNVIQCASPVSVGENYEELAKEKLFSNDWIMNTNINFDTLPSGSINFSDYYDYTIEANEKMYFYIIVQFNENITELEKAETTNISLTLNYSQANLDKSGVTIPTDVTIGGQNVKLVDSGDGLYVDSTEAGRYVYKGANPDNYIKIDNDLYRIIAVESDGTLKVIKNESIGSYMWDSNNSNVWEIASLNTYLNSDYLNTINSTYIVTHTWNVGKLSLDETNLDASVEDEKATTWTGKIGLINVTDYIKASTNPNCSSVYDYYVENSCYKNSETHNWIYSIVQNTYSPRMISGFAKSDYNGFVCLIYHSGSGRLNGKIAYENAFYESDVLPVFFLNSNITLTGSGTSSDPYVVG